MITALHSFEQSTQSRIILTIRSCGLNEHGGIWWEAKAIEKTDGSTVPRLLASAQLSCAEANTRTMEAAILKLMYALDFQLAELEWRSAETKGHSPRHT